MSVNKVNLDGSLLRVAGGTLYADAPIGAIMSYGGATAPFGWLLCQGQAISRTDYSDLFNIIGTDFGTGDGSTTFNIPDLRETVPVGIGENGTQTIANHDVYTLGEFKDDSLGTHTHPLTVTTRATYNTAGVPVGIGNNNTPTTATHGKQLGVNYIIKAKQVTAPADFIDAIDDVLSEFAKPISLQSLNNSSINFDKSRIIGGMVTICASITAESGSYLTKENAIARIPNSSYGPANIGYILSCLYRNTTSGAEEPGFALIQPDGNLYPYYTNAGYNEIRINTSYSCRL